MNEPENERIRSVTRARRVVVKLGTAVLTHEDGRVALSRLYSFIEAIAKLMHDGKEVILVTSGAVGLGADRLGVPRGPAVLPLKQAFAAVGQGRLMALYADAFDRLGVAVAQVLLTADDFADRRRYLNLRGTIAKLVELGALPIVNENDTVSTAELEPTDPSVRRRVGFGDNDQLSAIVAAKMEADLLLILTDVEGLYTADPGTSPDAELITRVERITPEIERLAGGARVGRGGMRTKLEAARIATSSGCATVVAGGRIPSVIERVFDGEELGTLFLPKSGLTGKQRWIAFATTVEAEIVINQGARAAIVERKSSLLAAGIVDVRGHFERGDVVSILDESGAELARGISNYSSSEVARVAGQKSERLDELVENRTYDAVVTRDNIAILERSAYADTD